MRLTLLAAISSLLLPTVAALADLTGVDPSSTFAYGENIGWMNASSTTDSGLRVDFNGTTGRISGYLWGENIGWIQFPTGLNGGVSILSNGQLTGFAWGENVGWIHFPTNGNGGVSVDRTNGLFIGHAWGENIGWVSFAGTNFGVRTIAFDRQSRGTPNWWLALHGIGEFYDAGDGVPAWKKYVMDVSPTNIGNALVISAITNQGSTFVRFSPSSSRRFYTLRKSTNSVGSWTPVVGQSGVAGSGGSQALVDSNPTGQVIYAIDVRE